MRLRDPRRAAPLMLEAWDEFGDLAETPDGVTLMAAVAAARDELEHLDDALAMAERFMPLAERFDLVDVICSGLGLRASVLAKRGRAPGGAGACASRARDVRPPRLTGQ